MIAAAHFGGYVCGTDIDYLILHGKSKPTRARQTTREPTENIQGNLERYGLMSRYLDVFVSDASTPVWRPDFQFDSIITDRKQRSSQKKRKENIAQFFFLPFSSLRDPRTNRKGGRSEGCPYS